MMDPSSTLTIKLERRNYLAEAQKKLQGSQESTNVSERLAPAKGGSKFLANDMNSQPLNDMWLNIPEARVIQEKPGEFQPLFVWSPPCEGFLKFNVDGSSLGKPGLAGIGGALRNSKGEIMAVFSKRIGLADSNLAELLAIREALQMFDASRWKGVCPIIIESDSYNAITWVNGYFGDVNWNYRYILDFISSLRHRIGDVSFVHTIQKANNLADSFAKQGMARSVDFSAWIA